MTIAASMLIFFVSLATAQDNEEGQVPTTVMEAFCVLYPRMKEVAWQYREPNFEASFKLNEKNISLLFDENGYVNEVKSEIMEFEVPIDINVFLGKEYPGWKVDKVSHIDANGTAYYEAVVEKEEQTIVLVFNRSGGLMIKLIQ